MGRVRGGGVPGIDGMTVYREAPTETEWRKMGIDIGGGGKRGGGFRGDGGIFLEKAEHGHAVHSYSINYGPVKGNRDNTGGAGGDVVVGEIRYRPNMGQGGGGVGNGDGRGRREQLQGERGRLQGWDTGR